MPPTLFAATGVEARVQSLQPELGLPPEPLDPFDADSLPPETVAELADYTLGKIRALSHRLQSQDYCGRGTIIGESRDHTAALLIPVRCKSWDCPGCGTLKRAAWINKLAAGRPTKSITLTAREDLAATPKLKAAKMHAAFRTLCATIKKELRYRPSLRWLPAGRRRVLVAALRRSGRSPRLKTKEDFAFAYVFELTKRGNPHLHVLARCPWIPQKWLSQTWSRLGIGTNTYIKAAAASRLEAAHSAKSLGKKTGTDPAYLGKDCAQTAATLAPMRIVATSGNWILPDPKKKESHRWDDYTWRFSAFPAAECARAYSELGRILRAVVRPDGSIELELWQGWKNLDPHLAAARRRSPQTPSGG